MVRKHYLQLSHVPNPFVGWFSASPHKAWGERFFLLYSPFWISFFAIIVATGAYERFAHVEYMAVCLAIAIPCFAVPLILQPKAEAALPFWKRHVQLPGTCRIFSTVVVKMYLAGTG